MAYNIFNFISGLLATLRQQAASSSGFQINSHGTLPAPTPRTVATPGTSFYSPGQSTSTGFSIGATATQVMPTSTKLQFGNPNFWTALSSSSTLSTPSVPSTQAVSASQPGGSSQPVPPTTTGGSITAATLAAAAAVIASDKEKRSSLLNNKVFLQHLKKTHVSIQPQTSSTKSPFGVSPPKKCKAKGGIKSTARVFCNCTQWIGKSFGKDIVCAICGLKKQTGGKSPTLTQSHIGTSSTQAFSTSLVPGHSMVKASSSGSSQSGAMPETVAMEVDEPTPCSSKQQFNKEEAETSNDYFMFVARVLVGRTCKGNESLRRPERDHEGKMTHTAVDYQSDPNIFVAFDNTQCYPEYLVQYNVK